MSESRREACPMLLYTPNRNRELSPYDGRLCAESPSTPPTRSWPRRISFMNEWPTGERSARHRAGAPGHRLRSAHRLQLPKAGKRLRRSCFPKVVQTRRATRRSTAMILLVLRSVEAVNDAQKQRAGRQGRSHASAQICAARTFALWGLAVQAQHRRIARLPVRLLSRRCSDGTQAGSRPGGERRTGADSISLRKAARVRPRALLQVFPRSYSSVRNHSLPQFAGPEGRPKAVATAIATKSTLGYNPTRSWCCVGVIPPHRSFPPTLKFAAPHKSPTIPGYSKIGTQ